MTRTRHLLLIALLLTLPASSGFAAPAKGKRDAVNPSSAGEKEGCESTGGTTKRCFVAGDSGELHIRISKDYPVLVTLDEAPKFMSKDNYLKHQKADTFVVFKLRAQPPKGHRVLLQTETMSLTLVFEAVSKGGDSQVHIMRSDRAGVARLVEKRVAEETRELKDAHLKDLERMETRAKALARKDLLNQYFDHGSHSGTPSGKRRARNDFLVARATHVTRLGLERFVRLTLEERKGEAFLIGDIRATLSQEGQKRPLDVAYRCQSQGVRPGKTVACSLSLGAISKRRGPALVTFDIDGASGKRSVRLGPVDLR